MDMMKSMSYTEKQKQTNKTQICKYETRRGYWEVGVEPQKYLSRIVVKEAVIDEFLFQSVTSE